MTPEKSAHSDRHTHCTALLENEEVRRWADQAVSYHLRWPWTKDARPDVAQETLLGLFKWCLKGGEADRLEWMVKHHAKCRAAEFLRRQEKHVSLPEDLVADPTTQRAFIEWFPKLQWAIERHLTPELRQIVELWANSSSLQEIAERIPMPKETVRQRLNEALALLRQILDREEPES